MSSWGEKLGGAMSRPNLVQGQPIDPKTVIDPVPITYSSFVDGLNLADSPEDVLPSAATYAVDMEVSRSDALEASPGTTLLFSVNAPHILSKGLFNQATIDNTAEFVVFDPPYFGYGTFLVSITWVNTSLPTTGNIWNARTIAGVLIASNGIDTTVTRAAGASTLTNVSATQIKAALTFASFQGRTYAGGVTPVGGSYQALGIMWSSSSGNIADFSGANSGAELLIQDIPDADQIIAMLAIGSDVMAILNRRSLWAVYPTNVATRPGDFRPRFSGIGCASRQTAAITPAGVTFLSDEGVANYNINTVDIISREINPALLPLDTTQLQNYRAAYSQNRQRYYLIDPKNACTWVYEFPVTHIYPSTAQTVPGRWSKRSMFPTDVLEFSILGGNTASPVSSVGFITGSNHGATLFVQESTADSVACGVPVMPVWSTGNAVKNRFTDLLITVGFEIEYKSLVDTTLQIDCPGTRGTITNGFGSFFPVTRTLPSSVDLLGNLQQRSIRISCFVTGMNSGIRISFPSLNPAAQLSISRVTQLVQPAGPLITTAWI